MEHSDAQNEGNDGSNALAMLTKKCHLRHIATNTVVTTSVNLHRPFSAAELKRREQLIEQLNGAPMDMLSLYRQLGSHRTTSVVHKDKALEHGKNAWMKSILPTRQVLYFGIQAKTGKLDAFGVTKADNANATELCNQVA